MSAVTLAFEELGQTCHPPLLIIHGFFAATRNWRPMAERLAQHYHVYLLDMRNHGQSPHHPQMDYPTMAADVLAFMESQGLDSASILGHSMGGKVAMWLALNYPYRVQSLIVADIAPVAYSHSFTPLINALKALPLEQLSNRKQAEQWLAESIPDLSDRQFLLQNLVLQEGYYQWRINLAIFEQMAPNIVGFPDTEGLLPFYGYTLFLAGENSAYLKAEDISELFPTARYYQIASAGHWLHVQQAVVFFQQVHGFLQTVVH